MISFTMMVILQVWRVEVADGTVDQWDQNLRVLRANIQQPLETLNNVPTHFTHSTVLDADGIMVVNWTPDLQKQVVVFQIEVRTLGYVGFGISENGAMRGADIITAWVKDGKLYLQDRHGVDNTYPPIDVNGHWNPIHAYENETHTVVTVVRDIDTCDPQDLPLKNETQRFIFAWGADDPEDEEALPYHGARRGSRFALTLLPFHRPTPRDSDYKIWTVNQSMVMPNTHDTFYWCHVEKVPPMTTKHHYIGFGMVYGVNSRKHLHHSVAFECRDSEGSHDMEHLFEKFVGHPGYECYTPSMPSEFYDCYRFFINWAIGSEGEILPETVGIPMGEEHGGPTYILFQTHYDNPAMEGNIRVDWAMDIYYTNRLRPNEGGNIGLGHAINFGLTIPPGAPHWLTTGHCSGHCTEAGLPQEGVRVYMVFLHGHYLARAVRLRHFRAGVELSPLLQDNHYDANFQQSRRLRDEVLVLPGDHLTVECDYNSTGQTKATFSGWKGSDEMCQAFINYYPRIDLALCRSTPTVETLKEALQLHTIPKDVDLDAFTFSMKLDDGTDYQNAVNDMEWTEQKLMAANKLMSSGEHFIKCHYNGGKRLSLEVNVTHYPNYIPHHPMESQTCINEIIVSNSNGSSKGENRTNNCIVTIVIYILFTHLYSFSAH